MAAAAVMSYVLSTGGMFPAPGSAGRARDGLGRAVPARVRAVLPARQVAVLPCAYAAHSLLSYNWRRARDLTGCKW